MRKYTILKVPYNHIKKVMIHETEHGTYVFPYDTIKDQTSLGDDWFQTLEEAESFCNAEYNIQEEDWILVNDPLEYCFQDIIRTVRTIGIDKGKPQYGRFEELIDGKWIEIHGIE